MDTDGAKEKFLDIKGQLENLDSEYNMSHCHIGIDILS